MQINVTYDQSISSLPTGFVSAVNYVVNYFDGLFTNNCSINIAVGYGECAGSSVGGALGESSANYDFVNYNSVKSTLVAQNAPGSSTLPATSPLAGSLIIPHAEAIALGQSAAGSGLSGYVGFSNTVAWDYTTATPSAGQYYLIGTIEHEFTEIMGRSSLLDQQPYYYTVMDLFRYSSPGVRDLTAGGSGSTAYFSVDGGVTKLGTWNNNPNNGDLGDWISGLGNDAANDYSNAGVINAFSATDILNMRALGWTTTSGPAAPTVASFSPDSGTVGDGITNATVLTLAGTAVANSTVNVYDGATLVGTATADGSGNWSLPTGTLSNGAHSFTATDTVSGTTSAASAALNVTVDTVAPTGGTPALTVASDSGSSHSDNLTNVTSPTFTVALNSTVAAGDTVQLLLGGSALAHNVLHTITAADVTAGSVSLAVTAGDLGADGAKSITAKFTDVAGNSSTTAADVITLDTTAPSETISSTIGTNTGSTTTIASGGLTNDNTLALSGTVSDTNGVTSVHVFDGATDLGAATIVGGSWNFTTLGLTDGTHSLTAKAVDTAGNTTTTAAVTATVDTTTPTGGTPALTVASDSGTSHSDNLTNVTSPTFTVALNSSVAVGDAVQLLLGGSALAHNVTHTITAADLTAGSVSLAVTAGDLGADGAKSITAKFTDAAGNTSTTAADVITLDTTAPVVTQTTASPSSGIEFPGNTVTVTLNLSQAVTVTGTPTLTLNDGGTATYTGGSNSNVLTFSYTVGASDSAVSALAITAVNLPNGATITDAAGNTANLSGALTTFPSLQIDPPTTSAPVITQFSPDSGTVGDGVTNATVLTLAGTATASSTVNVYDGATLLGTATVDGNGNWNFPTGTLSNGPHSFTATDTVSGTTSAASSALNVTVDTVAPTGGTPALTVASDSGSSHSDNLTNVTSPTFTVALNSTVAAGDTVQLLLGGSALAHNVTHTITAADLTAGSVSLSVTAGDLGADGAKSISAKFTDVAGNSSTTAADVITLDTTAPVVSEHLTNDSGSSATDKITASDALTGSGDANAVVTIKEGSTTLGTTTANASGAWSFTKIGLSDGVHTFVASETDAAGNTGSSAITFTFDTTTPWGGTPDLVAGSDSGSSTTDNLTNVTSPTFTVALNSSVAVGDAVQLLLGGSALAHNVTHTITAADLTAGSVSLSVTAGDLGADGAKSISARFTDVAGHASTTSALVVTLDTTAPSETISATIGTDTGSTTTIASGGLTKDNTLALSGTVSDTNGVTSVHVFDGATDLGAATIVGGNWNFTTLGLTDGTHSLTAKAVDTAGNTTTTAAVTATIDTTAPVVTQTTASPSSGIEFPGNTVTVTLNLSQAVTVTGTPTLTLNDGGTATYTGGSNSNVLTFSYTVGASDSTVSALAITAVNLPHGATITDAAGNTANLSGALTTFPSLQIDPPTGTPVITQFSPDSGTVGDGITNATVLTLAGTAVANSTVNVYDGATLVGTATADGSGNWSLPTGTLSNGAHSFTATDTVSGTTSAASAALNVTVDTVAPTGGTPALTVASDSGSSHSDNLTNVTSPTFTVALNSTVAAGDTVQLLLGGSALAHNVLHTITAADVTAGSVSLAVTAGDLGADGAKSITAKFTDVAGNSSTTAADVITLDTTAPSETISSTIGTNTGSTTTIASGGLTNDNTLALSGTVSDTNGVTSVHVFDGATDLGAATIVGGSWNFTTLGLTDGTHSLTAKAVDTAGNTTTTAAVTATVDTTTPTGGTPALTVASDSGTSHSDNLTNVTSPTFTVALNSSVAVGDAVQLLLGGSALAHNVTHTITAADLTAGSVSLAVTAGDLGADGAKSITAKFTDAAGNTSTTAADVITLDTTAPSETISATIGTDTGSTTTISSGGATTDNTLALSGTVSDTNGVTSVHVFDGTTDLGAATINAGSWSLTTNALSNGTHSFTAVATDTAGNATTTAAVTATVNNTVTVIEAYGSTTLTEVANHYYLDNSSGSGPSLKYGGADFVTGEFGGWTPIGAEHTAAGYEVAFFNPITSLYTAWNTDNNGNDISNTFGGNVSGTSFALESFETILHQDLNGDGVIGVPGVTVIEAFGSTTLTEVANHYYLDNSSGSGPSLKYGGADFVTGEFGGWTPIGAEHTATGYEVAWINPITGLYTAWNTDSNGNDISNAFGGNVSGTSLALESLETILHQDLNGDGVIGVPVSSALAQTSSGLANAASNGTDTALAITASGLASDSTGHELLTGSAEPNSAISIYDDNTGKHLGQTTVDSFGTWSAPMDKLSNTVHSITATATDQAGHTGSVHAVIGTAGNDTITNGAANEVLFGNGGADTFVFSGSIGKDTIADFQASSDVLQLSHNAFSSVADVLAHATQVGHDVTITFNAADSVTLHDTMLAHLTASNFHLV